MEIHSPRTAASSLRELVRELAIITAGILIALSLEGLVNWGHHRMLVRQARANILNELRENRRELTKEIAALRVVAQQTGVLVDLVHRLETNRRAPVHQFQYTFSIAELHVTSWNTAGTTGAVSYMAYDEVQRYTEVYDLQRAFEELQQRAFAASLDVEGLGTLLGRDPASLTTAELSDAERRLGIALADVQAMEEVAEPLNARYEAALKAGGAVPL